MRRSLYPGVFFVCLVTICCLGGWAFAQARAPFAEAGYVPPSAVKSAPAPLPLEDLNQCLAARETFHVFREFEGATKALKEQAPRIKGQPLKGGEIVETALAGVDLLGTPVASGGGITVYAASIISVDAEGVKLRLDVSGLQPGEEAWVVDPLNLAAFGPYAATTGGRPETWAATILTDDAVLLVKSPYEETPEIAVTAYSHLFRSLKEVINPDLRCHIDIACESDPATVEAASGVGLLYIGAKWWCSGTLINNVLTPAPNFEPFLITANHCICNQEDAQNTEVIWDYRSSTCGSEKPDLDLMMQRSFGEKLLATNAALDATLIELDYVPAGPYGRVYLGWDSRLLDVGEPVKCIHHPGGSHMRISKGTVRAINDDKNGRENQTHVHWDEGATEAGSSGSCLLLDNPVENNWIVGMLSQGPDHSCITDVNNIDWFASFHDFYPAIQPYIDSATPSTAQGADDCRSFDDTGCPLSQVFAAAPAALQGLRALRDNVLMPAPGGPGVVAAYYKAAPAIAPVVASSPAARGAVIAASTPFVRFGALVKLLSN
ncbi:MAG TPA: serine protease [Candidatus Bathyarchaeia archaeon]|nr:serine protease [Candidatus Bathyarchaeia archaeon]